MSWRDRFNSTATFRGVPFQVDSAELSGGRRVVSHEYPLRNVPFVEDMGQKATTFPVEGFVVGTDYDRLRDALITALQADGPGELVHPYYGTRRVMAGAFRVRDSADRGGTAQFTIEFSETPAQPAQPGSLVDGPAKVRASAAAARSSVGANFLTTYKPGAFLASVSDALRSAALSVDKVLAVGAQDAQAVAILTQRAQNFAASVGSLVSAPSNLVAGLSGILDLAASIAGLLTMYQFNPGVRPPATTARRRQEQTNFDATQALVQRLTVIRAAELAILETFESYDAAVGTRDLILEVLDEQSDVAPDEVYTPLQQLRADLVTAVPGEGSSLPRLLTYAVPATVPSLVIAHRLYGNVDLEQDIIARNRIRAPAFLTGGRLLQVLSDG